MSGSTYDPEKFYIASTDNRGHREQVRATNITPSQHGSMAYVLGSGVFPFKTFGDIVRDALHHRMEFLLEKLGDSDYVTEARKNLAADRVLASAEAMAASFDSQRRMMEIVLIQANDARFAGIYRHDYANLKSAWEAITFTNLQEEFRNRLLALGISPERDFDFE